MARRTVEELSRIEVDVSPTQRPDDARDYTTYEHGAHLLTPMFGMNVGMGATPAEDDHQ